MDKLAKQITSNSSNFKDLKGLLEFLQKNVNQPLFKSFILLILNIFERKYIKKFLSTKKSNYIWNFKKKHRNTHFFIFFFIPPIYLFFFFVIKISFLTKY